MQSMDESGSSAENFFIVISSFFLDISSSCLHSLLYHSILEMDGAIGDGSKTLIVGNDERKSGRTCLSGRRRAGEALPCS